VGLPVVMHKHDTVGGGGVCRKIMEVSRIGSAMHDQSWQQIT